MTCCTLDLLNVVSLYFHQNVFTVYGVLWFMWSDFIPRGASCGIFVWLMATKSPSSALVYKRSEDPEENITGSTAVDSVVFEYRGSTNDNVGDRCSDLNISPDTINTLHRDKDMHHSGAEAPSGYWAQSGNVMNALSMMTRTSD